MTRRQKALAFLAVVYALGMLTMWLILNVRVSIA